MIFRSSHNVHTLLPERLKALLPIEVVRRGKSRRYVRATRRRLDRLSHQTTPLPEKIGKDRLNRYKAGIQTEDFSPVFLAPVCAGRRKTTLQSYYVRVNV